MLSGKVHEIKSKKDDLEKQTPLKLLRPSPKTMESWLAYLKDGLYPLQSRQRGLHRV